MRELKCPHCGEAFVIDEAGYASIVNQIKNNEFEAELKRRIAEVAARQKVEQEAMQARTEIEIEKRMAEKLKVIGERDAAIATLKAQLESVAQTKSAEMQEELNKRDALIAMLNARLDSVGQVKSAEMQEELNKRDATIASLNARLESINQMKEFEMREALNDRESKISELKNSIKQMEVESEYKVAMERSKMAEEIHAKDLQIAEWRDKVKSEKNESIMRENAMRETHKAELKIMQDQVELYRDLKSRLSTKMIGESLEEHCAMEFERSLRTHMPTATFEKDNTVVEGTKGDFIYRNREGDVEYISIMFEMKHEADDTASKQKIASFFKKLDDDRSKKKCEYAVLVTTLEADNELYNGGIVDVSHLYDKMYVVRPQFFVPIITLLTQAAKKSLEYKRELDITRSQTVDVTNFENKLEAYKNDVAYNVNLAHKQFEEAIAHIDKSIKQLQDTRESLMASGRNLRIANDKAIEMTVRKLTYKNQTMKQLFAQAKGQAAEQDE